MFELLLGFALLAAAPVVGLVLLRFPAPYGRHARPGFGRTIPTRIAWMVMESPSLWMFLPTWWSGPAPDTGSAWCLGGAFAAHYVHRTVLYPLRLSPAGRGLPWTIVALGGAYNLANAWLLGSFVGSGRLPAEAWRSTPFLSGGILFVVGFAVNRLSDARLRALRHPGDDGYRLPRGGLFEWVSCPNYLGEIVQWWGFALASRSLSGLQFAAFTTANLVPRALAHHAHYRRRVPDYPARRRALVPFIL